MAWEDVFQSQIVDRGYDYYQRGLVANFKRTSEGIQATVKGSKTYRVTILIQNKQIIDAKCDCPYAQGGNYCKAYGSRYVCGGTG
ncbi:SWIM zinc finger family protein [Levilactobacillus sp. N40-8-2]|uniref:SWIM zinc finger family protein n=1 Tax=Levilactobacillus muriae TaxID=3238987 RepID=UPI0038B3BE9F